MKTLQFAMAATIAAVVLAACAQTAAPTPAPPTAATTAPTTASSAATDATAIIKLARVQNFGLFLTDGADRTLYAFDNDKKDTSNCTGNCLQNWQPFIVRATPQAAPTPQGGGIGINAALITTFARADGAMQAEYDGHPLYYFSGDKAPGDINGHGIGNVWHVLSPRGSPMTNPAPPTATKAP